MAKGNIHHLIFSQIEKINATRTTCNSTCTIKKIAWYTFFQLLTKMIEYLGQETNDKRSMIIIVSVGQSSGS